MKEQFFNKKIGAWVKGEKVPAKKGGKRFKITNVKEREPKKPFKGVKKR